MDLPQGSIMYCMKCRKMTKNVNEQVVQTNNKRKMVRAVCNECNSKKCKFI